MDSLERYLDSIVEPTLEDFKRNPGSYSMLTWRV
jgi:hypothetical protein